MIDTEPSGLNPFPLQRPLLQRSSRSSLHTHELPIGHAGAAPMLQSNLMLLQSTDSNTPVKPLPESPPLVVNTVTVRPT